MKRAVLICPGRGTYNATELGYVTRHADANLLTPFDAIRRANGQETLTALDTAEKFDPKRHTTGENASPLIFAAGLGDLHAIDRDKIELVAVTGNSMGWYTALACAGGTDIQTGFEIANTIGTLMHEEAVGGNGGVVRDLETCVVVARVAEVPSGDVDRAAGGVEQLDELLVVGALVVVADLVDHDVAGILGRRERGEQD